MADLSSTELHTQSVSTMSLHGTPSKRPEDSTWTNYVNHIRHHNPFMSHTYCEACWLFMEGHITWFGEDIATIKYKQRKAK